MVNTNQTVFAADVVRGFLLGRLSVADRAKFEAQLMVNDDLDERVKLAELQLADDFVLERLNRIDRQRFLKTFILTEHRRRVLIVSSALRDRLSTAGETNSQFWNQASLRWPGFFNLKHVAWRYAFGVLVLLALLASAWVATKQPQLVKRILPKRTPQRPASTSTPQPAHHPSNAEAPVHRETSPPLPAHESTSPNAGEVSEPPARIVALSPTGEISEASTISLPASPDELIRFQLTVEASLPAVFRAEVVAADGQTVFVVEELRSAQSPIEFQVPASRLKTSDYQIRLSRAGVPEAVKYYFRVQ